MEPFASSLTGHLVHQFLLKQRYRILGVVGRGGFGAVYKAEDIQGGHRFVAVKEMSTSGLTPQQVIEATETFKREALVLAGLTHPHLPTFYDCFPAAERWYVVMEFIEGETLEEHLLMVEGGCLPVKTVLNIGIQLCAVCDYLHTRQPPIIYRDLKPANIMLTPGGSLYLIDFGVARFFKPGQAKDTIPFGSPGYAAPEQYGRAQTTPQSDIYSLGVTLYQLLTGRDPSLTPFQFAPLQLPAPAELEVLVMHMVEMDESKRPASMAVVKQALQRIAAQQAVEQIHILPPGTPSAHPHSPADAGAHAASAAPEQSLPPTPPVQVAPPTSHRPTIKPSPMRGFIFCTYRGHFNWVRAVAWSPDGKSIASASEDRTVQVWTARSGSKAFTYLNHYSVVYSVAWSPDGKRIASAGGDQTVQVWDTVGGESDSSFAGRWLKSLGLFMGFKLFAYRGHSSAVHVVAWSPDGQYIASAGNDHTVQVWDALNDDNVAVANSAFTYGGHSDLVHALAWSPNGKHIVSASNDHTVRIWQAATGNQATLERKAFIIRDRARIEYAVAWSVDGKHIATASSDHKVRVWEVDTRRHLYTYHGHADAVRAVAWSPDGMHIVSGSSDQTVQVWAPFTGRTIFTHHGHSDKVNAVAWSPDGQLVASASHDGTVQVWQAI